MIFLSILPSPTSSIHSQIDLSPEKDYAWRWSKICNDWKTTAQSSTNIQNSDAKCSCSQSEVSTAMLLHFIFPKPALVGGQDCTTGTISHFFFSYCLVVPIQKVSDYVYMGCNNPTVDLILNKTIFQLRCLHQLPFEYLIHIPVYMLQSTVWLVTPPRHTSDILTGFDLKLEVEQ